jgi:hypothetical protein
VGALRVDGSGVSSSGRERRRLILVRGGIVGVVFELGTRWVPNVGSQHPKALTLNTGMEKCEGSEEQAKAQRPKSEGLKNTWIQ